MQLARCCGSVIAQPVAIDDLGRRQIMLDHQDVEVFSGTYVQPLRLKMSDGFGPHGGHIADHLSVV